MRAPGPGPGRSWWVSALLGLALLGFVAGSYAVGSMPAFGQAGGQPGGQPSLTIRPVFPTQVTVGETGVPASLVLESRSLLPLLLTSITLDPSCSQPGDRGVCAPSGAVGLSPAAAGTGSACSGARFQIAGPDPAGRYSFAPAVPILLLPLGGLLAGSCTISFTIDAIQAGAAAVHQVASVRGLVLQGLESVANGASEMVVNRARVTVDAVSGRRSVPLGQPVAVTATLGSPGVAVRVPSPTGTVTLSLFGPADPTCSGPPVHVSAPQSVAGGPLGTQFSPLRAGVYRWAAEYSGDPNYEAARSACTAESTVVKTLVRTVITGPTSTRPTTPDPTSPNPTTSPPTTSPPTTSPAPAPPPTSVAPAVTQPPVVGSAGALAPYDPVAEAEGVVGLGVSAFALLALAGSAGGSGSGGGGSGGGGSGSGGSGSGEVVFTEVESAQEGLVGIWSERAQARRGDRSWTWRWPGTAAVDRLSLALPTRLAPRSPLLARVVNDAGYLRAILGSAYLLLPVLGAVLATAALVDVGGQALPPRLWLAGALAVLGVVDALAGLIAVAVFVVGVALGGGLSSADAARTMLGLAPLWFAAPLIAGTARPLRHPPTATPLEHWNRTADIVIASLVGAWAVKNIVQGLPGLSGLDLPIAGSANSLALVVLAALALRMVGETVATHWYPLRLGRVQPEVLRDPSPGQRVAANAVVVGVFVFVAVSYLGSCWQLYLGGTLFILPRFLGLISHRLPNSARISAVTPRGLVEIVVMIAAGTAIGALALALFGTTLAALRNAFVLLSLPGMAVGVLELFGAELPERELTWGRLMLGIPVLVLGVLLVLDLIG